MAMVPTGLGDALYKEMESVYWPGMNLDSQAMAETKKYYNTLATALIEYTRANMEVIPSYLTVPSVDTIISFLNYLISRGDLPNDFKFATPLMGKVQGIGEVI
jgi:hypothetical protein